MRIFLAAHRNEAPGIATVVRGLTQSLPFALGPDDELLIVGDTSTYLDGWSGGTAKVRLQGKPAGLDGRYSRFVFEQGALPMFARSADLVHMGDCRPLLLSRQPFVVTIHDLFFLDAPAWFSPSVRRFKIAMLKAIISKGPAAIVCVSEYTRGRLYAHVPQARHLNVSMIHPGIEAPSQATSWQAEDAYFLTLSEANPRKNLLTLLRAFQMARKRGLKLRWKVAGPPGFRSKSLIAALSSVDGVDVLGHVSQGMREALYQGASFMAFPSHAEGFGLPPLEAMARGVPTICSTGTAMDETLGEASLRVAPGDVRGWTEGLLRLASEQSTRAELSDAGLRQAQKFTMARMAKDHADMYRSTLRDGLNSN